MGPETPAVLVRGVGLFAPLLPVIGLCLWRAPRQREIAAMIVAGAWSLLTLVPLNLYALHAGWWSFHAEGAVWLGIPVDLLLAWAVLWGVLPALLLRLLPVPLLTGLLVWVDVIVMPLAEPVVVLGSRWLLGEFAGSALCLIPALLLAYWTRTGQLIHARTWAQAVLAFGLMVAAPLAALGALPEPGTAFAAAQVLALVCLPGLAAAREFALVGGGTPLPFDPPSRLVTSGPYAYLRNPMQTAVVALYLVLSPATGDPWPLAGALAAFVYGAGFAQWHEGGRLREAFGRDWEAYRSGVRSWLPLWRPWQGRTPGTLYVASDCDMCRGLGGWLAARAPVALEPRPAAEHTEVLYRLTYEAPDGLRWSGVRALARALEHLHLGWALVGWAIDLPGPRHVAQLCADAFGAGPRPSREPLGEPEREGEAPTRGTGV
ncbi:protein-S-isoprenylcysteine O-methyltransferase Ste14 [Nocardiopsis arvandica]|uniref:Protein-S-isoprenylcysteine O-methyltransferase Ste14 n=1 Tax=Nocardiopsis sinuspersici TaxID=501010 RepID=A0A7Y9XD87_9ACTN|nr:methyltransferase [Nocardiopsis sinuspersici]NYH53459.1 protein-S-isoprenylcysteine O-methyltransferase Ste14 [Nocardiopsis sinuspersici]